MIRCMQPSFPHPGMRSSKVCVKKIKPVIQKGVPEFKLTSMKKNKITTKENLQKINVNAIVMIIGHPLGATVLIFKVSGEERVTWKWASSMDEVLEEEGVIKYACKLIGATYPQKSEPRTIRCNKSTTQLGGYERYTFELPSNISEIRAGEAFKITNDIVKYFTCTARFDTQVAIATHYIKMGQFGVTSNQTDLLKKVIYLVSKYSFSNFLQLAVALEINGKKMYLVSQGCITPLCDLLIWLDPSIVTVSIQGLKNILKVGELEKNLGNSDEVNFYAQLIDDAEGMEKIENLQSHDNNDFLILFIVPEQVRK
ncbi:hypothetical protein CTI12_AA340290 [Artemisia annua]|uniref:Uncharacterized protein n=1 Tax=Artemisia annua TaxID=35608 RepID=A0A2U1MU53_ARTAN|nr:hypothetical protein CTI12_AA340290 [Artemisia annua]